MIDQQLIAELEWSDAWEMEVEEYVARGHIEPVNVSHWDPSPRTQRLLQQYLSPAQAPTNEIAYRYSYVMDNQHEVMRRLGFNPEGKVCLYVPTGTSACLCTFILLSHLAPAAVSLIAPYYFVVRHQLALCGLNVRQTVVARHKGKFTLPAQDWVLKQPAVVLTSPVYSTGMYYPDEDVARLHAYLENGGILIADESLAAPGRLLPRTLGHHPGFIGIYTPHKALCINGIKFSCIIADQRHEDVLYRWGDIVYGSFAPSSVRAIDHYLSPGFDSASDWFMAEMLRRLAWLRGAAKSLRGVELDAEPVGHFVAGYLKHPQWELGSDLVFIRQVMEQTGAVFFPGVRSHFDPAWGFSFRINLALADTPRFRGGLLRLFRFLLEH